MDEKLQKLIQNLSDALQARYEICHNMSDDEHAIRDSHYAVERAYMIARRYCETPLFDSKEMLW